MSATETVTSDSSVITPDSLLSGSTELEHFVDTSIVIKKLDFSGVFIREALTALARQYGVSIFIDTSVTGTLTMRLENVSLDDAFRLIIGENNLSAERIGSTLKISKPPAVIPEPPRAKMSLAEELISISAKRAPIQSFVEDFTDLTRINVTLRRNVSGSVTGSIVDLPIKVALHTLLESNEYILTEKDNVFVVGLPEQGINGKNFSRRYNISFDDGMFSID
ncbi:secretin and TonB N-terminal domain-containing protein, partial [bacterium AH-315-J21]|nr:secretin and TonB N-terminal domain-containing protein [bacterium AH-315-J21]